MNRIEIWEPKYSTGRALIAAYKVKDKNEIVFTKAKHLEGKVFEISKEELKKYPTNSNGRISCYSVPMDDLMKKEKQ